MNIIYFIILTIFVLSANSLLDFLKAPFWAGIILIGTFCFFAIILIIPKVIKDIVKEQKEAYDKNSTKHQFVWTIIVLLSLGFFGYIYFESVVKESMPDPNDQTTLLQEEYLEYDCKLAKTVGYTDKEIFDYFKERELVGEKIKCSQD